MATTIPVYTMKQLSPKTWPDFERLFSQGNGWDFCWCMHFQRTCGLLDGLERRPRSDRAARNRPDKLALVEQGASHGILVYCDGEPVGWCQYGPREELQRIDNSPHYRRHAPPENRRLWRITCFVVDKRYRRRGVGSAALRAALDAINKEGGGLVEAFPLTRWDGASFGNVSTHGTASMFAKEGFKKVAAWGNRNVLMRRIV